MRSKGRGKLHDRCEEDEQSDAAEGKAGGDEIGRLIGLYKDPRCIVCQCAHQSQGKYVHVAPDDVIRNGWF